MSSYYHFLCKERRVISAVRRCRLLINDVMKLKLAKGDEFDNTVGDALASVLLRSIEAETVDNSPWEPTGSQGKEK